MAQFYQVTSLEEFRKLYPNIQLENIEGIPCMIQDDQVTQYADGQGPQVIATVEQSGIQLSCNPGPSQQCTSQQTTQFVIQQMDANESQAPTVQYIQQRQQSAQTSEESHVAHFKDQSERSLSTDVGGEEHSRQQCSIKQGNSQQYLSQVQPVLQQHIQLHPQIQAVDMAGNVLVLQNQEQPDFLLNQTENQNMLSNTTEKQQQQSPPQILIQRSLQHKSQELITQKCLIQQNENSQDCIQHQMLQSSNETHGGSQQQQVIHQTQQQIIQPLQYFNQVTVIDSFSHPRVTIEHHPLTNENLMQQQVHSQIQQYKSKKSVQQSSLSTIMQQPQVLVPQAFEMSSPPPLANPMFQNNKKVTQDIDRPTAPVFIVQKVDSPFLIRQQAKIRFQNPLPNDQKPNENSFQSVSTLSEPSVVENISQENRQTIPAPLNSQANEVQSKLNVSSSMLQLQTQQNKCSLDRGSNYNQVKIGIIEQPLGTRSEEQINKLKVCSPLSVKTPTPKLKTNEQQTATTRVNDGKEIGFQQFQKFGIDSDPQSQQTPGLPSQMQSSIDIHSQSPIPNRGRVTRPPLPRGQQFVPRPRGVQMQVSPARLANADRGGICKKLKSPRGGGKGGRGGWMPSGSDQRQVPLVRGGIQQVAQSCSPKNETNQTSNEVMEEAKMVVLLINGEKKILKIPCSQNLLLGQILQQAGLSLTSQTPIAIEQVGDNSLDSLTVKSNLSINPQLPVNFKSSNVQNSPTPRSIIATIQQRPRGQSPFTPQVSNVSGVKNRSPFVSPRVSSPGYSGASTIISNAVSEITVPQSQNTQNSTPLQTPAKEESRFVSGLMAICPFCGISSLDFNRCIRCRRKLPENVKAQSIFSIKKKEKASLVSEKLEEFKSDSEDKQADSCKVENKEKNSLLHGSEKKKPKPCFKKKKISDEPTEILILSSDEEEETKAKKIGLNASTLPVLKKEPVYTDTLSETEMNNLLKESNLNEDLMKNVQPGSFTTLQCRTVRIGSYKVQPKERIFVSPKGIRMVINSLKNESVTLIIPVADILKVLFHFGKQIPVIFLYPVPKIGCYIRDLLGMENKMGPYYDPTSTQEETHKRITFLLEKISEDNKTTISKIFGPDKLEELSEKEANEILIRASPVEMQNSGTPTDTVRKILVYPPPPEKGGITLNNQDYACLGEDQFLNDVIIDFYLKYLMLKILSPADRNRTHVFSTFFYKRLTTKPKTLRKNDPENDPKLSPAEKRHMRVKGWTKQVNLFEKDFIIVPINEHSHWFLAIICFPGLSGPVRFSDNMPIDPEEIIPKKNSQTVQIGSTTITHIIKSDGNTISLEMDSGSDRDEAEGDQDDLHPSSDDEGSESVEEPNTSSPVQIPLLAPVSQQQQAGVKDSKSKLLKRKSFKEPIKQPCILIFDSLAGASRVRVVATLRDYLKIEYKKKMGHDRNFSKDTIKGAVPKVPQQNNFTDCGLYVLQYVESFFQDPLHDFKLPLKYLQDWFPEEVVSSKRQKLAFLIRSLMEEQGIKVEEIGLPVLTFTSGSNAGDEQSRTEDDEVDDEEELNEEEAEILRARVQISEFENEDGEELNLEDEDEIDDDDEDEEFEEEEMLDEEIEDEEFEVGEMPSHWVARSKGSCCELDSSVKHGRPVVFKTTALVEYDPSDSDDDNPALSHNSVVIRETQRTVTAKTLEERDYSEFNDAVVSERIKAVPLTEFQDFESQISCTTIERNLDSKNFESNVIICEEDAVGELNRTAGEEASFKVSGAEKRSVMTDSFSQSEKKIYGPNEIIKDDKAVKVTDIIKKLVNDKNITISRKEDENNSSVFKKHLDVKKFKVIDCDKGEESEKATSPSSALNANLGTYKRPYQTLKSVRIPKKAERNLEICYKRQKVDER